MTEEKTEKLTIGIVGLGLIGGSLAKALKENTPHTVLGFDKYEEIIKKAHFAGAIDGSLSGRIPECDVLMLALYPLQATEFVRENAELINKKTIVIDCCGTKSYVCEHIGKIADEKGFTFIGGHPMAGIERFGFDYSKPDMFKNASMIFTLEDNGNKEAEISILKGIFARLGFSNFVITTPENHDRIIAYTSQLAHVVSSAYIQSPTAEEFYGFSAGSFKDMTRVARLNETMWTELFCENSEYLADEIDSLSERLREFSDCIRRKDEAKIFGLLKKGCESKEKSDEVNFSKL